MHVTNRHDMTLAVKMALNPNTTNPAAFKLMTDDTVKFKLGKWHWMGVSLDR